MMHPNLHRPAQLKLAQQLPQQQRRQRKQEQLPYRRQQGCSALRMHPLPPVRPKDRGKLLTGPPCEQPPNCFALMAQQQQQEQGQQ